MMTSELRASDGRRSATYGLLFFAAVAIAMLFLAPGKAYAADTSSQNTSTSGDGAAAATSGDAKGTGANSATAASQEGSGSGTQAANASTTGKASANSGGNTVTGNSIGNRLTADQSQSGSASNRQTVTNTATGTARLDTGDAVATGANATTNITQKASGGYGSLAQSANVSTIGTADANTGNNDVAGNAVGNNLFVNQERGDLRGRAQVLNRQDVDNNLAGRARVTTGDADATGANAWTSVAQIAVSAGSGHGGVANVNQSADVVNHGDADVNTGRNNVAGNDVRNDLTANQSVQARGPPRISRRSIIFNRQDVDNRLTGSARLETGNATGTGLDATTSVDTYALVEKGDGDITQRANVENRGNADVNTGNNDVAGNAVRNRLGVNQSITQDTVRGRNVLRGRYRPFNRQDVNNNLVGRARLSTGDADGTGTVASTSVAQEACANDGATISQSATARNIGYADANTGRNDVFGNDVNNRLRADQSVWQLNRRGRNVARGRYEPFNRQDVRNLLTGRARVETGDASATGVWADNAISQEAGADGDAHVEQSATVENIGARQNKKGQWIAGAIANSGNNNVAGNDVNNRLAVDQSRYQEIRRGRNVARGRILPFNRQTAFNNLVGAARLETGDADATGVTATNSVSQTVCCEGSGHVGQHVTVRNIGVAEANSGRNDVFGNRVTNRLTADQSVLQVNRRGRNVLRGRYLPFNRQDIRNFLVGSARLATGDADATGSWSDTTVEQLANVDGDFDFDVTLTLENHGDASADSGSNVVAGNDLLNRYRVDQSVEQIIRRGRNVLRLSRRAAPFNRQTVQNGNLRNPIVGRARLETGAASATGNVSHASVRQVLGPDVDVDCCKRDKKHKKHHKAHKGRGGEGGGELAFTGAPLGLMSLLGLLLIALGGVIRRRSTQVVA